MFAANFAVLPWVTGCLSPNRISWEDLTDIWPSGSELGPEMRTSIRIDEQGNVYIQYTKVPQPLPPGFGEYQAKDRDSGFTSIVLQMRVNG